MGAVGINLNVNDSNRVQIKSEEIPSEWDNR